MPLNRPILDDRSYEQLRDALIRRIPVYAPEWTDHNVSDPGITLIELFAFLGENLLYRFNQIPEATYLEYLRLLQIPLHPARPARALVAMTTKAAAGERVPRGSEARAGDIPFETRTEVRVLPVSGLAVAKAAEDLPDDTTDEGTFFEQAFESIGLTSDTETAPYRSRLLTPEEIGVPVDFNGAVDGILWVAVLAEKAEAVATVRQDLADHDDAPLLLNIGFVPEIRIETDEEIDAPEFRQRFRCPGQVDAPNAPAVEWQISTGTLDGQDQPVYQNVAVAGDTTAGLTREGVLRLRLPADANRMKDFAIDNPDRVGTGDLPPRLEDEDLAGRVIFWMRAFRHDGGRFGKVLYVGLNAAQVEQTRAAKAEFLGTGNGQPNQVLALVHKQAVSGSLTVEVEDADGWRAWQEADDFQASGESDRHYVLDSEAGRIRFGNGLQGYAPQIGQRIRARGYRYGGGVQGNVPAGSIKTLARFKTVEVSNPLAAYGGEDAETIAAGMERIPGELRRRDRAVTRDDFRELALMTPGARIGRAECLPRFHALLPDEEAAGVVSVIVWPREDARSPNAPMPDRNQLRAVCAWLDARRLVTTELYVLPPRYRAIAVAVGLRVKPGYGLDAVRHWVELVIRQYLAPLPPYGPSGEGWPLGRRVHGPELEAAALQVEGVEFLEDLQVVGWDADDKPVRDTVVLARTEVPELIDISVEEGPITVDPEKSMTRTPPDGDLKPAVPVPVLREEC